MNSPMQFGCPGPRVRDRDKAIEFFVGVLGMKLRPRVDATWSRGYFANRCYGGTWIDVYNVDERLNGPGTLSTA